MRPKLASGNLIAVVFISGCGWQPNTEIEPPVARGSVEAAAGDELKVATVSELEDSFIQERLGIWRDRERKRRDSRIGLQEEELVWHSTAQDPRVALLVSTETGFDNWGIETAIAEIPAHWQTGRHRHGEEAIYVVSGRGFIEIDGTLYDIDPGTTVGVPFGTWHRLYNTGEVSLRYFSATSFPLERYLGLYRMEQSEACGPIGELPRLPASSSGLDNEGRRIRLLWEDADYREGSIGLRAWLEARLRTGMDLRQERKGATPFATNRAARLASGLGHHSGWVRLMGHAGEKGFPNRLALINSVLIDAPGVHSGRHAHMEAVLYVLSGTGYSVIDGEKVAWKAGSSLHIQGPQTWHQHFNTGDRPSYLLRVTSGLRPYLQEAVEETFPFLWSEAHGRDNGVPNP